jgi:2'-5' RNA ligase
VRLFFAIDPGSECRRGIAKFVDQLRGITTRIRWVKEEKLHITLAFLGEVDESQLPPLTESARRSVSQYEAFRARVDSGGVFPDWRRPRVIWLALRDGDQLLRLGNDVLATCAALGFPSDHPFRAHLTIGRVSDRLPEAERASLQAKLATAKTHHFDVTRVMLMRSVLGRAGSVYSELASFPLGGA